MTALTEILQMTLAFSGVIAILFFGLNFLTKGFIVQYLKVKGSRGKKILLFLHTATDTYFRPGQIIDGFMTYTDRNKKEKKIEFDETEYSEYIGHTLGVPFGQVDENGKKMLNLKRGAWDTNVLLDGERVWLPGQIKDNDGKIHQVEREYIGAKPIDAGRLSNLILKIKSAPQPKDKILVFVLVLCIVNTLIIGFIGVQFFQQQELVQAILSNLAIVI